MITFLVSFILTCVALWMFILTLPLWIAAAIVIVSFINSMITVTGVFLHWLVFESWRSK